MSRTRLAVSGKDVSGKSVLGAEGVNFACVINMKLGRRKNVTRRQARVRAIEVGRERLAAHLADQRDINRIAVD